MKTYSIYRLGVKKHDFVIEDDDIRRSMSHDNNVSFNVESKDSLDIKIGDYIIEDGSHYTIYDPIDVEESNGVFSYPLVFRSPDYKLKFSIVKDEGATTFPYHGGIKEFVDLVILSLNEDQQEYTAGDIDEGNIIDLEFDNSSCFQALDDICEAANMEWNLIGTSINVKYRIGKDVDVVFEYGKEKGGYSVRLDKVQNTSIVTRLIGKGGTINLPKDYVSPDTPKRLNLGNEILEKNIDKYGKITGVYTNDNIYPRLINKTVLEVTIPEDIEKATSWKLKLDLPFDLSQQYADDKTPLIKFQTGDLTGSEFEIVDNSWNNTDKTLQIIVQEEEDGYRLPNTSRQPRIGDVFVLLNINMPQSYIDEAEEELRKATQEELNKRSEPQYAPSVKVSKRFLRKKGYSLEIGDSITVKVGDHSINTRILAINQSSSSDEINYELGDEILYSYEDNVNNQIEQIQVTLKQLISLEDVRRLFNILINQWRPLWFDQKLHTYDPVEFNSVTSPLFIFNELTTPEFVSGLLGAGTRLKDNHLELDEITVRKRMNVFELLIQRVRAVGGQLLLSPASIKISTVEELENGYKCSFNTDDQTIPEPFVLNDQAFHQTFTGKGINRYWRLTTEAGDDYFVLSKTDCEPGSGIPQPGDEVILLGNRTDKARQSAMMLSAYGNDAPYLDTYDGINDYNLSGKLLTREGNLTGIVDEVFGQLSGSGFYGKNVYLRGKFALSSGVSVEDKFGQTDSQMNNLQGQLTNQQGQLNTQQGQITNIQTDILAIPGQIKQEVSQTVTYEVGNLQIGMVNLLKGSNVELGAQAYNMGRYYYDKKPEVGKTYTLVTCYTLGEDNTSIGAYQDGGSYFISSFTTKGDRVVESKTFKYSTPSSPTMMTFYQFPNGTYGSKVHWAVLVEGNKGPNSWIPSQADNDAKAQAIAKAEAELAETKANAYADGIVTEAEQNAINEAQARLDALKIGSVNLVSRKMMLAWNEKNKDIAVWGQDSDGIYLAINQGLLYTNVSGGTSRLDCFLGEGKYKANTQYVFSVEWKLAGAQTSNGVSFWATYTDGTNDGIRLDGAKTSLIRESFITAKGKTVTKIYASVGANTYRSLIYSLALYEGNKVLAEPPVATEDLTGQSNVNLVDGGKEVTVASDYYSTLKVPVLKPNTVYTVRFTNVEVISGDTPSGYEFRLYDTGLSANYSTVKIKAGDNHGILITSNNFTVPIEGRLLFYPGIHSEGIARSVKYTEIMLVEGFTPPSSYSPSPGDVQKEIDDVSDAVSNLDTTINTTFKDGIISEAEAKAIASNINVLNAEKADIDAYYTKLYANAYLTGTAKTNLASAKTAYNTAHTNLINSINTAIADGKATATEKADVDAKFSAYNNALSAYQTRVGEADKAIQDTIKKVADDAQTSANTTQSAANAAQSTANQAQADANAANSKLATWASDNYISPQEKTGLKQQKSDIQAECNDIVANANRYNISSTSYSTAYNSAISALNKYTATSPENIAVSSDYNNIAAYYTARQTILNSIAAAAKAQADKATGAIGMDGGKMLYADPEFKKGLNNVYKYTNSSNVDPDYIASKLTVERVTKPSDAPTQSGYCLKVTCKAAQAPGYGGVHQSITSRANAVFVQKIIAKIPVGYKINTASNSMGTGYTDTWLTPTEGTGKYTTYLRKVVCGTTGNFSSGGHVYITGSPAPTESAPLEWYIAYMTAFDLTADGYGDIVEIAKTETVAGINNNPDSVTVYAKKTDFNSLNQVVNQQGSQLQVNTNSIDAIVTKNGSGTIVSIKPEMVEITGATVIKDGNGNKVNIFGIGDKVISVNGGVFSVDKAGKVIMQNAEIAGKITAKTGQIGDFTIDGIWLKGSQLRISGRQITFENGNNQVYLNSHPDMTTGGAVKLGTFVLTGGSYNGLESARAVALIAAAPSDNYSCAIADTSGRVLMKGQIHFDNVVTYTGSGAVTITADSGHFIYLTPITGNPVVSVSSGLPIGSWFIIAHATTAGGCYYIKLSGSDRFRRRGRAYQQVNSNNQDPSLIFKVNNTTWVIGNLPVNWIDWN